MTGRSDFSTDLPASPHQVPEVEPLLRRVVELLEAARPMPLSTSVMIQKDEILELLDEALERLPEELRAARWLLKEREEFLVKVRREGDDILDEARGQAARMVERTEVVKSAEQRARGIIEGAEEESRRMRHEVEDFCDQRLSSFETVLERTIAAVHAGRERLQATAPPAPDEAHDDLSGIEDFSPSTEGSGGFFDQDV